MRVSPLRPVFVASLFALCGLAVTANAQQGVPPLGARPQAVAPPAAAAPAGGGTNVVVIDVAYVFKNHVRFNAKMNEIKREIEQYDAFVRDETKKLQTKKEQLITYKQETPEYKRLEEEGARLQSDLQIKVAQKRREFLEAEARAYFDIYKEIEQTVAVFAQRNRISLVLRFNGEDMKADDRNSVMAGVNRAVVYQQNLDISNNILQELNPAGQPVGQPVTGAPPIQTSPNRPIVPRPGVPTAR